MFQKLDNRPKFISSQEPTNEVKFETARDSSKLIKPKTRELKPIYCVYYLWDADSS